jgi:hypothetical protein
MVHLLLDPEEMLLTRHLKSEILKMVSVEMKKCTQIILKSDSYKPLQFPLSVDTICSGLT